MLPLSYPSRWHFAGIFLLLAVLVAAMVPDLWPWPGRSSATMYFDKWMHGLTFACLAIWYSGQYRRDAYWKIAIGLLAFGALIEICQSLVTYRTAEIADFAADGLGVVVGILLALAGLGGWSLKIENWLADGSRA